MLTPDILHYFEEIYRVLDSGGIAMVTFFVIDGLARKAIEEKKATADLQYQYDEYSYYSHKNMPEAEIGFLSEWIEEAAEQSGLTIEKKLYGSWSGRPDPFSYQDILVLRKK
jgi:ubiquinone/menaquinone biosynthesis C-methylase UbiE